MGGSVTTLFPPPGVMSVSGEGAGVEEDPRGGGGEMGTAMAVECIFTVALYIDVRSVPRRWGTVGIWWVRVRGVTGILSVTVAGETARGPTTRTRVRRGQQGAR